MKQAGARPKRNLLIYVRSLNFLLRASAKPLPTFSRKSERQCEGRQEKTLVSMLLPELCKRKAAASTRVVGRYRNRYP